MVTTGAGEAILLSLLAITDQVMKIIPDPCWLNHLDMPK